ncbi:hypothetical protein RIF29_14942 [Crotalaria pallida]|uniref:Auxin response factor domain-containing protein n=1 Tax=Crotalaria pallida TaxID=3830 RepID=A0AAN9IAS2_CROPI
MKIVEIGGDKELLNMLSTTKDDGTRKAALAALDALSHSGDAVDLGNGEWKRNIEISSKRNCMVEGENGELRLGIRRAVRPRNGLPESVVGNQNCYPNFLSSVANAISTKSMFHVFYSPRCNNGMVIGMSDLDPYRWPKSKWRCLMVRWDENKETNHQDRVSPWEIDPSASLPQFSIQSSPRLKKLRMGQQATSPSHLFTGMHPNAEIKHTSSFLTTC